MPRKSREYSTSKVYHVIFRGNDKQDVFYDDQDKYVFLDKIKESKKRFDYKVYSYCLMNNHIHLVIRVKDELLSKSMHNLGTRYSMYFNKKMDRRGHLFENRYLSKKVENITYFLNLCKYVHRNPENANIEKTTNYKWSSFQEYIKRTDRIIDSKVLLYYFNNDIEELKKYTLKDDKKEIINNFADLELIKKLDEEDVINIIKEKFNLEKASDVSLLEQDKMSKVIRELKEIEGTSLSQIARITKVSRYKIKRIWDK